MLLLPHWMGRNAGCDYPTYLFAVFCAAYKSELPNFQDMHKSKDVYDIDAPQVA
jgi:hypothetical protein